MISTAEFSAVKQLLFSISVQSDSYSLFKPAPYCPNPNLRIRERQPEYTTQEGAGGGLVFVPPSNARQAGYRGVPQDLGLVGLDGEWVGFAAGAL